MIFIIGKNNNMTRLQIMSTRAIIFSANFVNSNGFFSASTGYPSGEVGI